MQRHQSDSCRPMLEMRLKFLVARAERDRGAVGGAHLGCFGWAGGLLGFGGTRQANGSPAIGSVMASRDGGGLSEYPSGRENRRGGDRIDLAGENLLGAMGSGEDFAPETSRKRVDQASVSDGGARVARIAAHGGCAEESWALQGWVCLPVVCDDLFARHAAFAGCDRRARPALFCSFFFI